MLGSPRIRVKRRSGLHQKVNTARDVGMTEMLRDRPYEGAFHGRTHRFALRVYFEDTDTAGVVYYANFLCFMERGRPDMLRRSGEHTSEPQSLMRNSYSLLCLQQKKTHT